MREVKLSWQLKCDLMNLMLSDIHTASLKLINQGESFINYAPPQKCNINGQVIL